MPKIFYFEDDEFLAEMFATKLREAGFEVKHYSEPPENILERLAGSTR